MTEAEENLSHWKLQYESGLAEGRERWQFGMQWMADQIRQWEIEVKNEQKALTCRK